MIDIWNFALNNQLGSGIAVAVVVLLVPAVGKKIQNKIHGNKIYSFLQKSEETTPHTFRSTEAIASKVKLTEARVENLCTHHPKIKRNSAEKQSWRLIA